MAKSRKKNRCKSQSIASILNSGSNRNGRAALFCQISVDMIKTLKTWDEVTTSWMRIADSFCQLKDDEIRSEVYLEIAETLLLAPMQVKVKDEFSVRPRSMIRIFEAWENIYDAVIEACSQNSIRCCTFAIKLASQISQMIACEKMDCRLLFVFSRIIRAQIEYFNYDVLSDVFVGDFDLSGKGNILDSFCKLIIETGRHSIETLLEHADKQIGIALELMSKSIFNILEAATSLVSLMTKPTHILFVVGALSEFISTCLFLVTEKDCRMFYKNQTKNVAALVRIVLTTLRKHYSGPYDTSLLDQLEPVFIKGLRLSRLHHCIVNFWQQTFGRASHLDISDELSTALEQAKCASRNFVSEQKDFPVLDNSKASISYDTNLDFSADGSNDTTNKNNFEQSPSKSTEPSVSKCRMLKHVKDNDMDEYAVIDVSHSEKKMHLTDHQKEKLMERSDSLLCLVEDSQSIDLAARIPPGYADNSSQENSSAMKASKTASLVKKRDAEYNYVANSRICVQSRNQDLTGDSNENDNYVGDTGSGCNNVVAIKNSIVLEDKQDDEAVKFDELCKNNPSVLQSQTSTKKEDSGELAIVLLGEHMRDTERKVLEGPTLSMKCKTPEIAESHLESVSPKANEDEPMRTPNSILKKCGRRAICPPIKFFSASAKKCKRVHFDASTLDDDDINGLPRRKIFRRSKNSLFSGLPPIDRSESTSPLKRPPIPPTNRNPADAVFPALIGSEELIPPQIYLKLAPTMSSLALRSLMKSRGVATVGDLACMSEEDIETFPFRDPKLSRFLGALEDHFRMKNMVSKADAIELEKIMKRPLNSPADCLEEVNLQSTEEHQAVSSKIVQELSIIDAPEVLGKTTSETSGNETCKSSAKYSYVNPFQNGSKRFTPYSVIRLDNGEATNKLSEQPDSKGNRIIPSFEVGQRNREQDSSRSQFGFIPPFIKGQELVNVEDPISVAACERNNGNSCVGSSSLSEHDNAEERLAMKSPEKLPNGSIGSSESNNNNNMNNMKPDGDKDEYYDDAGSLRKAYHVFLENSVVAALAGVCPVRKFSSEQLLSFSQACASFQMAVLGSSKKINNE
ncbi:hypothetical protein LOAG_07389 [Loa loa]|uniref:Uncharacterized protein n=1 Tax=Loa loa TaxID=7209 RepID=A0A1S0TW51_LOALO|nr:hypothetical protein LOAG_07389 [Loa loa]EFO21101.2 hypothetical protein LOAG_07389 [Loa loa]